MKGGVFTANNIKGITIEIGGNTGPLSTALKDVNKTAGSLQSELNQVNRQLKFDPSSTVLLTQKQNLAALSADALKEKQAVLKEAVSQAQAQFEKGELGADKVRAVEREYAKVASQLDNLKTQAASVSNVLGVQMEQAAKKISDAGENISSAGKKVSGVGQTLTMGVTAPIVGIGIAAAKTGIDFEAQMSRVQAVSGATSEQLKQLTDTAMDLGQKTTYSDQQVAEGMENLAQAGFSASEVVQAMPGMLNLAASSGEDLASSADIAASTLRGFGLAADQAGHVADVLAKNAASTNAAVADTGLAMKYIAPLAQNAGWSLEQTTAAIGEMSNAGVKGEKAGTTLRGALTNLVAPSKEQAAAMKEVGLTVYDANGKMNSLSSIIDQLQKGTSKMTNAQRDNVIATIMGADALSGMDVLIQNGSGALDTMTQSLKNSDGAAQDMATTMLDNAKGSIEAMKGSVENAEIALSKALSPAIRDAADKITDLANDFAKLPPSAQENIVKFGLMAAAIGPATLGLGKMTEGIGALVSVTGKGVGGIANFVKGVAGIVPVSGEAVPVMTSVGSAMGGVGLAAAGAVGAFAAVDGALVAVSIQHMLAKQPIDNVITSINAENKAWKDLKDQQDKKASSDLEDLNHMQSLWNELNSLVDANGRVKGSKEEVKYITDQINQTTGKQELSLTGDIVSGYDKAKGSIDQYIQSKRAQILIDAKEKEYKDALQNLDKAQLEQADLQNQMRQLSAKIEKDATDQSHSFSITRASDIINEKDRLERLKDSYNDTGKRVNDYYATRQQYDDATAAIAQGDYNKAVDILNNLGNAYSDASAKNIATLYKEMQNAQTALGLMLQNRQKGNQNITDADIAGAQDRYNKAEAAYDAEAHLSATGGANVGTSYAGGLGSQQQNALGAGSSVAQSGVDGLNSKQGAAGAAGASLGSSAAAGAKSTSGEINSSGYNLGDSLSGGFNSKQGDFKLAGTAAGESIKSGAGSTDMHKTGSDLASLLKSGWDDFLSGHPLVAKASAALETLWGVGHNATGTDDWSGGLTYINENGGEIVDLPQHTRIIPHDVSMEMARNSGKKSADINLNFYGESYFGTVSETKSTLQQAQFAAGLT